jgi:hypothetical protein
MHLEITDSEQFTALIQGLADDIVKASFYFRLYRDLNDSIPEYLTALNHAPTFWRLVIQAQREVTLFRLCRAYDSEKNSLSLFNWLDTIEGNLDIFEIPNFRSRLKENPFVDSLAAVNRVPSKKQLDRDKKLVASNDTLVNKLIRWRNNIGAHRSPKETLRPGSAAGQPLTLDEIGEILERATRILNDYSGLFRAVYYSVQPVGADDFKYVLESVRQRIEEDERKFQEELRAHEQGIP